MVTNSREVTFNCDPGYFLSTETHHFICKKDGNWNSDDLNPKCIKGKNLIFKFIFVIIKR